MKKFSAFFRFQLLIFLFCLSVSAQDFRTISDGVEYAEMTRGTKEEPVHAYLLRLDPLKVRLDVVHAMDAAIGVEKTSSIAARHGAIAAINSGFFRLDESSFAGDAAGVLMIDGQLLSESLNNRIAVGVINGKDKTEVEFGHLKSYAVLGFGADGEFVLSGINRERKHDEIILYTPEFNRTTLTVSGGTEIILSECVADGLSKKCGKAEVFKGKGSSAIPAEGYVISIGKDALEKSKNILYFAEKQLSNSKKSETAFRINFRIEPLEPAKQNFFSKAEDITNGVSRLVKNGKIEITWQEEKAVRSFAENRHPRTAIAKLKDGKLLLTAVDGRQPGFSVGMTLLELAEFLLEIGAEDAINLDGGGSTTMYLEGKVVNRPSDKEGERRVGDAILVFPRRKS
jgi:Exopolysaccharide biosynthesis protein related to N-acetylglucosamine-1-phosphodiester alpha-N-acetylglucosaminidase